MGRLILLVIVLAAAFWLYKHSAGGLLGSRGTDSSSTAPIERARAAARSADERQSEADRIGREAPSTGAGGQIHENMTPADVRALMGEPDEVISGSTAAGAPRETWIYRNVGKKVVFENGVAVQVE